MFIFFMCKYDANCFSLFVFLHELLIQQISLWSGEYPVNMSFYGSIVMLSNALAIPN